MNHISPKTKQNTIYTQIPNKTEEISQDSLFPATEEVKTEKKLYNSYVKTTYKRSEMDYENRIALKASPGGKSAISLEQIAELNKAYTAIISTGVINEKTTNNECLIILNALHKSSQANSNTLNAIGIKNITTVFGVGWYKQHATNKIKALDKWISNTYFRKRLEERLIEHTAKFMNNSEILDKYIMELDNEELLLAAQIIEAKNNGTIVDRISEINAKTLKMYHQGDRINTDIEYDLKNEIYNTKRTLKRIIEDQPNRAEQMLNKIKITMINKLEKSEQYNLSFELIARINKITVDNMAQELYKDYTKPEKACVDSTVSNIAETLVSDALTSGALAQLDFGYKIYIRKSRYHKEHAVVMNPFMSLVLAYFAITSLKPDEIPTDAMHSNETFFRFFIDEYKMYQLNRDFHHLLIDKIHEKFGTFNLSDRTSIAIYPNQLNHQTYISLNQRQVIFHK